MNTVGEKLRTARTAKKLSQSEAAEKLLVSRQTISKWENDVCLPDLEKFQRICELYDISPDVFFDLEHSREDTVSENQNKPENNSLYSEIPRMFWIKPHKSAPQVQPCVQSYCRSCGAYRCLEFYFHLFRILFPLFRILFLTDLRSCRHILLRHHQRQIAVCVLRAEQHSFREHSGELRRL